MGAIISKFRKEKTTFDVLTTLDKKIQNIEEYGTHTERLHKKIVANLLIFSVALYIIAALVFYFCFLPVTWIERVLNATPLLVFPFLIILLKKVVAWYYNRKLTNNALKLSKLKREKVKILEDVMDKETYKVAKTILEHFAGPQPFSPNIAGIGSSTPIGLRQRPMAQKMPVIKLGRPVALQSGDQTIALSSDKTLVKADTTSESQESNVSVSSQQIMNISGRSVQKVLPRPVISQNRSVLDKMVDYLVGDGPNNRFAMICKQCHGHNGMALEEEFVYLAFRCAYCYALNPARKQRLSAPPLSLGPWSDQASTTSSSSDSAEDDKQSGTDSEFEKMEDVDSSPTLVETREVAEAELVEKESIE